jgi:hypothetical protein
MEVEKKQNLSVFLVTYRNLSHKSDDLELRKSKEPYVEKMCSFIVYHGFSWTNHLKRVDSFCCLMIWLRMPLVSGLLCTHFLRVLLTNYMYRGEGQLPKASPNLRLVH